MANFSVRKRRLLARGISSRIQSAWARRTFVGTGSRKSATIGTGNSAMFALAKTPTSSPSLAIVVAGNSTAASVSVTGADVTFNAATDSEGAATSTAGQAVDALNRGQSLIWLSLPKTSDGRGVVAAAAKTNLT